MTPDLEQKIRAEIERLRDEKQTVGRDSAYLQICSKIDGLAWVLASSTPQETPNADKAIDAVVLAVVLTIAAVRRAQGEKL